MSTSSSCLYMNYCSWVIWPQHPCESLIIFALCYFRDTYCSSHFNFAIYCPRRDFAQNATILKKMRVNLRTTRSLWLSIPRDARNVHKERFNLFLIACSAGAETVGTAPAQTWALSSSFPTLSTIWTPVTGFFHLGNGDDRKLYSQAYTRR